MFKKQHSFSQVFLHKKKSEDENTIDKLIYN